MRPKGQMIANSEIQARRRAMFDLAMQVQECCGEGGAKQQIHRNVQRGSGWSVRCCMLAIAMRPGPRLIRHRRRSVHGGVGCGYGSRKAGVRLQRPLIQSGSRFVRLHVLGIPETKVQKPSAMQRQSEPTVFTTP